MARRLLPLLLLLVTAAQAPSEAERYRADARSIAPLIAWVYAYPERLSGGPLSPKLAQEAEAVADRRALLRYAERALHSLADHHAITGASFADSRAVVPSFADLWVERVDGVYRITAVRAGSPAEAAAVREGDALLSVEDHPIADAVAAFWADLGLPVTDERASYAARVLAAGRRDRPRRLGIRPAAGGAVRTHLLPNLYAAAPAPRPPVTVGREGRALLVRFNDSLGDSAAIAAFDAAMAGASPRQPVVIDLTDTPSGGNTVVARAILGWFVSRPSFYQIHRLPMEERETGIPRQWAEQVLPRAGKRHRGRVTVRVGRWTGSMGEGLAIGFAAIGADVRGGPMAGLLGAIYDHPLATALVLKIPTERLYAVDGTPRENWRPRRR